MTFAMAIVRFCGVIRISAEGRHISGQLLRSGTSVAANYRASRRARSRREFVAKLGIVIEECDEALFWLELLNNLDLGERAAREQLMREANELTAIFIVTRLRARRVPSPG
jgi:four helix bundle protein